MSSADDNWRGLFDKARQILDLLMQDSALAWELAEQLHATKLLGPWVQEIDREGKPTGAVRANTMHILVAQVTWDDKAGCWFWSTGDQDGLRSHGSSQKLSEALLETDMALRAAKVPLVTDTPRIAEAWKEQEELWVRVDEHSGLVLGQVGSSNSPELHGYDRKLFGAAYRPSLPVTERDMKTHFHQTLDGARQEVDQVLKAEGWWLLYGSKPG